MKYIILTNYEETQSYVDQVCKVADDNRKSFGFLPDSVYEQMASKGQLWVAVCERRVFRGYLMFGGKMPALKVSQIYVSQSSRGNGLGKLLIKNLIAYAEDLFYHTIIARVASDLKANPFWESSGFRIHRQEKGGRTTGRTINVRAYKLPINDLLSTPESEREPTDMKWSTPVLSSRHYAFDLNPIFDVAKNREHGPSTLAIIQMGLAGEIGLCLTPEFEKETLRYIDKHPDDPMAQYISMIPIMGEVSNTEIDTLVDTLRSIVFPNRKKDGASSDNDRSDLSHIAYCIAGGINGFITREKALLKASSELTERYGVSILSPDELLPEEASHYVPKKEVLLSNLSVANYSQANYSEVITFLESLGVEKRVIDKLNLRGMVSKTTRLSIARLDTEIAGFLSLSFPSMAMKTATAYLFVDESHQTAIGVIDHFIEFCLRHKTDYSFRLDMYVSEPQTETVDTAVKKGFLIQNNALSKFICHDFISKSNWASVSSSMKTMFDLSLPRTMPSMDELSNTGICITDSNQSFRTKSWFDFETILSPMFCLPKGRGCLLVPIRENYANGLIGDTRNQLPYQIPLLDSSEQVLMLEKAYFRSPSKSSYFSKGAIVAFYVSQTLKELIGFARVTYSEVLHIEEVLTKFKRQGVLSKEELSKTADKKGMLHVFTFDNFFEFNKRVSFSRAKKMNLISGANLVSVEKIDHHGLKQLIGEAF
jgi:L-amino acid N-acyltransferase YncA